MAPKFFFSYAHDNRTQHRKLDQFFDELVSMVAQKTGCSIEEAGFMDRLPPGVEWQPALVKALQGSAVFVAMVSMHYIGSAYCGKELQVFSKRRARYIDDHPGANPGVIIPITWMSTPGKPWPEALQPFQHAGGLLPAAFANRGLHSLMMSNDVAGYNGFLELIADAIVAAAALQPALEALTETIEFENVENAFAPAVPAPVVPARALPLEARNLVAATPDVARLFYVAAPQHEMDAAQTEEGNPPQRLRTSTAHYGKRGYYWQPFHPTVALTVGHIASGAVSGFEYKPGDPNLADRLLEEIREADEAGEIAVVIVDPWALRIRSYRQLMSQLDQQFTAKSCVIVPWNEDDQETRDCQVRLHAAVRLTFQLLNGNASRFRYPVKSCEALTQSIKEMLTGISLTVTELLAAQIELGGPPLATLSNTAGRTR
jgi:FxsC-like protein